MSDVQARAGLPGLRGFDHVGFTVPDLAQARAFFTDVLGWEFLYELGPYRDLHGSWMTDHLNVDPRAEARINFYRVGGRATFEVFEYRVAHQRLEPPRNSDVGGHHVALYVEDLDAAVRYLRAQVGVRVLDGPKASQGAHQGQRWIYFLAPWGMQFELVSYPQGRFFYREEAAARSPR